MGDIIIVHIALVDIQRYFSAFITGTYQHQMFLGIISMIFLYIPFQQRLSSIANVDLESLDLHCDFFLNIPF